MGKNSIIHDCIAVEKAVASIYSTFIQLFPQEKTFWEDLFNDEIEHLSFLIDAEHFGIFQKPQTRVPFPLIKAVERTLKFVEEVSQEIRFRPVSLEDALTLSLKLEETMVETFANKAIADMLATDDESFTEKLLTGEKIHIDKIRLMMVKKGFLKWS
jgi:hypothetical protein